jgi:protein TonB
LFGSVAVHAALLAALPPLTDMLPAGVPAPLEVTLVPPQPLPQLQMPAVPPVLAAHQPVIRKPRAAALADKRVPVRERQAAPSASTTSDDIPRGESTSNTVLAQDDARQPTITLAPAGATDAPAVTRSGPGEAGAALKPIESTVPPSFNAAYLRNPPPRYPLAARLNGEQGTVTLKVLVTQDGLPSTVTLEKTSGFAQLDAVALQTVRRWRFVPARIAQSPVDAWVIVPIVFRLEEPS